MPSKLVRCPGGGFRRVVCSFEDLLDSDSDSDYSVEDNEGETVLTDSLQASTSKPPEYSSEQLEKQREHLERLTERSRQIRKTMNGAESTTQSYSPGPVGGMQRIDERKGPGVPPSMGCIKRNQETREPEDR